MTTMTAQLPLPLAPAAGVPIGLAACLVEDCAGGRAFINGQLSFTWDDGDVALRRLAAVQLVRIKAALGYEVAAAFGVDEFTVYRWRQAVSGGGSAALAPAKRGPKGPSKLTEQVIAEVSRRHAQGAGRGRDRCRGRHFQAQCGDGAGQGQGRVGWCCRPGAGVGAGERRGGVRSGAGPGC